MADGRGRLSYAVVDIAGNVHPMGTLVAGVHAAEVKARLAASHPISSLPPQEEVKRQVAAIRAKATRKPAAQKPDLQPGALRAVPQEQQSQRRQELAKMRSMIEERHRRERLILAVGAGCVVGAAALSEQHLDGAEIGTRLSRCVA